MKLINIKNIKIPRTRTPKYDTSDTDWAYIQLVAKEGLSSPIILHVDDSLCDGLRRVKAITYLSQQGQTYQYQGETIPPGLIPYVLFSDLPAEEANLAYFEEVYRDRDSVWQDKAEALLAYHTIMQAKSSLHTLKDTAIALTGRGDGYYMDKVRKGLLVARHLMDNDVQYQKSIEAAYQYLKEQAK